MDIIVPDQCEITEVPVGAALCLPRQNNDTKERKAGQIGDF